MHGVIVKHNKDEHRGYFSTTWVMKTCRLIIHNSRPTCSTNITSEEYLCKQIEKSSGRLENIFFAGHIQKNTWPYIQCSVNIIRGTLVSQSIHSASVGGKVEENHATWDIMNKGSASSTKPCAARTPNENHEAVSLRSGWFI